MVILDRESKSKTIIINQLIYYLLFQTRLRSPRRLPQYTSQIRFGSSGDVLPPYPQTQRTMMTVNANDLAMVVTAALSKRG